jgi:haloacetate dehalogenase
LPSGGPLDLWYEDVGGPISIWRAWAADVTGKPLHGGHFLPEQNPEETGAALQDFLT